MRAHHHQAADGGGHGHDALRVGGQVGALPQQRVASLGHVQGVHSQPTGVAPDRQPGGPGGLRLRQHRQRRLRVPVQEGHVADLLDLQHVEVHH
eukprot:3662138-Pyramimonas_sp.AAC.1